MATTTTIVGAPARPGELLSERIAPGILPKVLGRFDMIAIFVAIVLFAVQGSVVQQAGASAFVYWILGFLTFLIPGAIVTGQLGLMFPGEGSIYVWTNKALGAFWGFFAGFCAWWPGALVMVATADLVVTLLQFLLTLPPFNLENPLGAIWQQGVIILAVIWFSSALSILRFRVTQNLVNGVFVIYGAAILTVGLAGLAWLLGGHPAANDLSTKAVFGLNSGNATFYGLVILALLGIEVPLNMGRVNRHKVPHIAVLTQAVITSVITFLAFFIFGGNANLSTGIYIALQAAVTVIWCLSMVFLFVDVLIIRSKYPEEFKREQLVPVGVFWAASIMGAIASAVGVLVTLTGGWLLDPNHQLAGSWNPKIIDQGPWILIVGGVALASLGVAVIVYLLGLNTARRAQAGIEPSVAS